MFDFISEWLGNFAGYMILLTIIMHIVPNKEFQKYVRFLCGLIMILLMLSPVIEMMGMEERVWEIYESREYENVMEEFREQANALTGE